MRHMLVAAFALAAPAVAHETLRATEELATLELDELIARLPLVQDEHEWLTESEGWLLHPIPAEMKRRMERGTSFTAERWLAALRTSGALRATSEPRAS